MSEHASHAERIAQMWAQVSPEHLEIALKALEPELQREHEHRLETLRRTENEQRRCHQEGERKLRQLENEQRRRHVRYLSGLWAGFALAAGMLTGGVIVGVSGQTWLAALLTGPSLLALAKLFVIRRADASDTQQIADAQRETLANSAPSPSDG
ncbi:hypothetical protein [Amycolatopsis sp. NPDC054798]